MGEYDGTNGLLCLHFPVTVIRGGDGEERGEESTDNCGEHRGEIGHCGEKGGEGPSSQSMDWSVEVCRYYDVCVIMK